MEITGSAITALFVALVWTLINVVKYFITKYGKQKITDAELVGRQARVLEDIYTKIEDIERNGALTKEQQGLMKEISNCVERLYEMHAVYNNDHIPAWYVPKDLMGIVRETSNHINILYREMEENLDDVKQGQTTILGNMSELITSQKLMTERLGDLISALNKISR